ncbi:MAG: site-2 protease family protein [Deltaproteobacteria bacterium]|nr:site-2 protease family protein [Deltaproteobacteria bacterium]
MSANIVEWIIRIPVLLFAITIHEYAHGKAALSLGDPTAKNAGRLTLNPISHIDPIGAICFFLFYIGWAKPVPVDTRYFKNPRRDIILMALSGPIANFAAAFVTGLFIRHFLIIWEAYLVFLLYMILMNIGLGLFNLIPIPPLDGSHVLENMLPSSVFRHYEKIRRYVPLVFIGILLFDRFLNLKIVERILWKPIIIITQFFGGDNATNLLKASGIL